MNKREYAKIVNELGDFDPQVFGAASEQAATETAIEAAPEPAPLEHNADAAEEQPRLERKTVQLVVHAGSVARQQPWACEDLLRWFSNGNACPHEPSEKHAADLGAGAAQSCTEHARTGPIAVPAEFEPSSSDDMEQYQLLQSALSKSVGARQRRDASAQTGAEVLDKCEQVRLEVSDFSVQTVIIPGSRVPEHCMDEAITVNKYEYLSQLQRIERLEGTVALQGQQISSMEQQNAALSADLASADAVAAQRTQQLQRLEDGAAQRMREAQLAADNVAALQLELGTLSKRLEDSAQGIADRDTRISELQAASERQLQAMGEEMRENQQKSEQQRQRLAQQLRMREAAIARLQGLICQQQPQESQELSALRLEANTLREQVNTYCKMLQASNTGPETPYRLEIAAVRENEALRRQLRQVAQQRDTVTNENRRLSNELLHSLSQSNSLQSE